MRSRYRILVAAALIFSLFLPVQVLAAGTDYKQQSDFWTWIAGTNSILKDFIGYTSGAVCPKSEDGYHHASSYVKNNEDGYYTCICSYCGERFVGYEDDVQQSYDSQVLDLPASGVTSSGNLLFNPLDYPNTTEVKIGFDERCLLSSLPFTYKDTSSSREYSLISGSYPYINLLFTSNSSNPTFFTCLTIYSIVPISGVYTRFLPGRIVYHAVGTSGSIIDFDSSTDSADYNTYSYLKGSSSFYSGDSFTDIILCASNNSGRSAYFYTVFLDLDYYPPIYEITPFDTSIVTNDYNINSRPTSITGDYGIIGDNGQITKVDTTTIVNETNNTYTNPSTGTTSTITDWTYDYSDRSYDLTLDTGDTVTVTYGDENVTIQEGDTVYNIYYIVDGTGQGTDPGVCQHNYISTINREATCTVPGQMTYTCSLCGHTYTETIPAKGHTWTVSQTVTTEYDEEGNLLQQGYTLYQCSVCGEQYKDEDGTGPPGSDGSDDGESIWDKLGNFLGSIFGGLIGLIEAVLGAILDALTSLATMIGEKLATVVELVLSMFTEIPVLFTGFLGFLTAVFPFLPEDVMLLLTFGIAVIVFIGIIKALRR